MMMMLVARLMYSEKKDIQELFRKVIFRMGTACISVIIMCRYIIHLTIKIRYFF